MVDISSIIEGTVKFRDGKKWKSRWCVMRKLSPVADCLHLQLYRDSKDRYKQGQTKASLSLQHFLGAETGFTLDKESNTVAIICQDVIVVLAFDTRERLIQWQVKIAGHLGEDQQYLVLVSSAPSKAKVTSGPARMHVQDGRFCLTTGVPPKLAGLWEIGNLRRYGVVDGRFCFEGGSLCGKGEGLYILLTDQGEDITHALKMAAQGKLTTRRRTTMSRKLAGLESPRKTSTIGHNTLRCQDESCTCASNSASPSYWPSQESQGIAAMMQHHQTHHDLDCNYGCGDTVSVSDMQDSGGIHNETWACGDTDRNTSGMMGGNIGLERCMSCISKLGAPSMSRSSTVTTSGGATPGGDTAFSPGWGERAAQQQHILQQQQMQINRQQQLLIPQNPGDRSSLCSHGSSSCNSEYSVPRCANSGSQQCDASSSWYERIPAPSSIAGVSPIPKPCQCGCQPPSRPPKPTQISQVTQCGTNNTNSPTRRPKPPMPLPISSVQVKPTNTDDNCACRYATSSSTNNPKAGPYENYDTPKIPIPVESKTPDTKTPDVQRSTTIEDEYYDTPKRLKESLAASGSACESPDQFGNYDTPPSLMMGGTCLLKITKMSENNQEETIRVTGGAECPCQRVMSWADNWIPLGYCRRGYGMENTALNYRLKINGDGRMPLIITQPCADSAIYATVDKSKKMNRRNTVDCACSSSEIDKNKLSNYENIEPISKSNNNNKSTNGTPTSDNTNYANIEFAQSLEHYENAKGVLRKAGITAEELQVLQNEGVCNKCGHAKDEINESSISAEEDPTISANSTAGDDYLMMEPSGRIAHGKKNAGFPGYIPMSPAQGFTTKTELLKQRVCRLMSGEKSASNPALTAVGPAVDRSRKRAESEMRVPGSAMMLHQVYSRKQLMDSGDSIATKPSITGQLARKRSSSADSSRYLEDVEEFSGANSSLSSPSSETLRKSSVHSLISHEEDDGRRSSSPCLLHREIELPCCPDAVKTADDTVNIRRSSSVPCKSGQNRDSSSSNDSGVSTGSLKQREYELETAASPTTGRRRRLLGSVGQAAVRVGSVRGVGSAVSNSNQPPRRSRSFDPLGENTSQMEQQQTKSSSAEAEIPICTTKNTKGYVNGGDGSALGPPYMDSRSTSSGTSDMSDYIETLSLSSHSSSDAPDSLRMQPSGQFGRQATTTLRPRSGKEYQNIDRAALISSATPGGSYAGIAPVLESPRESPSPGYMSGSSPTNETPIAVTPTNTAYKITSVISQQPMQ